jgi:hypothetical protein
MNDELHHLLDGELPDEATADLLRSLVDDGEKRALFREQMKLQGALIRNEGFASMSSGEEAEMLGRVSSAIGVSRSIPWAQRFGSAVVATIVGALIVGGGLGFFADQLVNGRASEPPPTVIRQAAPPIAVPTPPPCNCDSAITAVRDSVSRAATTVSVAPRKAQVRAPRRSGLDDPTGREAAKARAKMKKAAPKPQE